MYLVSPGQLVRVDCVRPPILEGHNSSIRALIWVFLDSMKSPLSQEYIDMSEDDSSGQTEVLN